MIRAFKLFTGPDGKSRVQRGRVVESETAAVTAVAFQENPQGSSSDWHHDPTTQYVVTLSGTLEFTTGTGETFTVKPGDILIVLDSTGSGHKWRLIDDEPWKRAYVIFRDISAVKFQGEDCLVTATH
jgi:quercetin dioxygenase-like cupin family protein